MLLYVCFIIIMIELKCYEGNKNEKEYAQLKNIEKRCTPIANHRMVSNDYWQYLCCRSVNLFQCMYPLLVEAGNPMADTIAPIFSRKECIPHYQNPLEKCHSVEEPILARTLFYSECYILNEKINQ